MTIYNKQMQISDKFKNKLESTIGTTNTEITYIPGGLITLDKVNFDYINPNKIIIKKNKKEVIILSYGKYYEDEEALFINDISNKITWHKLKTILG